MITNYKINKKEIVFNFNIKNFKNINSFYTPINEFINNKKIKFYGNKIIIYLNGIYLGNFYISKYYLKKFYIGNYLTKIDNSNSYFVFNKLLEINKNIFKYKNIY